MSFTILIVYVSLAGGGGELNNKQWCDEALEDLINAYKPHECLWITSCEDYKDQDKKAIAFNLIDIKMRQHNFIRFEYTKKWAILRGQFLREVRRERCSSHKSGWRWYSKLEFLKRDEILFEKRVKSKTDTIMLSTPYNNNNNNNNTNNNKRKLIEPPNFPKRRHMLEATITKPLYPPTMTKLPLQQTQKPPQKPPPIIHHDEGVRIEYITPSFIERKEEPHHRRPSLDNTQRHPTPPLQPSPTSLPPPTTISTSVTHHNQQNNNDHPKQSTRNHTAQQQQKQDHNNINNNNNNSNNNDDQESLFGKMVASTLRKFTSYQRVVARKKIQDLLFEIELQNAADVDNNVK